MRKCDTCIERVKMDNNEVCKKYDLPIIIAKNRCNENESKKVQDCEGCSENVITDNEGMDVKVCKKYGYSPLEVARQVCDKNKNENLQVPQKIKEQVDKINSICGFMANGEKYLVYCKREKDAKKIYVAINDTNPMEFTLTDDWNKASKLDNINCAYYINTLIENYNEVGKIKYQREK